MEMLKAIGILLVGFVLLIKGADFFVEGSSTVAKKLRIPSIIVGLTIVAMGTSLPELAVSTTASLAGNNAIAISNVVGSNLFNLIVVCGSCALFSPLAISKDILKKDFPIAIGCGVLLLVMGIIGMEVCRIDGIILSVLFITYISILVRAALKARANTKDEENVGKTIPVWLCIIYIVGGIAAIKFGGDFVVDGAVTIAGKLGLSENLIGLTIVAVGTSLPELVTSIVASRKNEVEMAVGNVLGSNIFNILLILGVAGTISPMTFIMENIIDIVILTAASLLIYLFSWTKERIDRKEGIVMLLMYASYLVYICIR
ncbi:MAG: calcium/sodium antiporter [Lachnospiraceae bacterium]|jgi:cation:H+ antiporter|nr:calcium/sodium antiporter [Lachnospiraceae bacterium]